MKNINTKIIILFFLLGIGFLSFVLLINQSSDIAAEENLLAAAPAPPAPRDFVPIGGNSPFVAGQTSGGGFMDFLDQLFTWGITIALALSLVYFVFGAVLYMTTDAISGKKSGKERMQAAIGGLILALISWLILYTINPDILTENFFSKLGTLQ